MNATLVTDGDPTTDGSPAPYCVLGGGPVATSVARRLRDGGHDVLHIDEGDGPAPRPAGDAEPVEVRAMAEADIADGSTVVVATASDSRNLLIAQLVSVHFDVADIVALVSAPERCDLFASVGYDPVCATTALTDALVDRVGERERERGQTA